MTPIELLRKLFNIDPSIDDFEAVAIIFKEATENQIRVDMQQPKLLVPFNTEINLL